MRIRHGAAFARSKQKDDRTCYSRASPWRYWHRNERREPVPRGVAHNALSIVPCFLLVYCLGLVLYYWHAASYADMLRHWAVPCILIFEEEEI